MNNTFRSVIVKQIVESLKRSHDIDKQKVASGLKVKYNSEEKSYLYLLPVKSREYNIEEYAEDIKRSDLNHMCDNVTLEQYKPGHDVICFSISRERHVKRVVECYSKTVAPPELVDKNRNLIVEFSSPNIAKPFHFGHLRSTMTGNYVANINSFLGERVKKINYLGDWGTQFGFVQLGVEEGKIGEEELERNSLMLLQKAYVSANEKAKTDPSVNDRAREIFRKLESGDPMLYEVWSKYKGYTVKELEKTYGRIGVSFDEYHWESMYHARNTKAILERMERVNLLETDEQNRRVVRLTAEKSVPILKSDGSTLYITRDIAAAIDRYEKNKFDSMYYVVDNTQGAHFSNLISILKRMELPWAERLHHVGFGRINGMSSRKGTAVLLDDILNEMRHVMRENQRLAVNTKIDLTKEDPSADILGVSAIIVNNFKHRRRKDYTFDWNQVFDQVKGDTGIRLQYSHCRLVNLEENSGARIAAECDPSLLKEPSVDNLILSISQFDEAVLESFKELEPCVLCIYLFGLSNTINAALKTLTVKGQPPDLQDQRLLLFHTARNILAEGMKLLGLIPLNQM